MSWVIFGILTTALFVICGQDFAIDYGFGMTDRYMLHGLFYPFFHASWLHLGINTLSLAIMVPPICKLWQKKYNEYTHTSARMFGWSYVAAIIAGWFCATPIPTIGASGMVFFLLGLLLLLNPTRRQAQNYLWVAAAIAIQWYFGKSNVALHLFAFVEGALFVIIKEFIIQYKSGVNRGIYQY